MQYELTLTREDYLRYYLYNVSTKATLKKQVNGTMFTFSLLYFVSITYFLGDSVYWYFLIAGIVFMIFYPIFQKKRYYKHYNKHIDEVYHPDTIINLIEITDEYIWAGTNYSESKLRFKAFEKISEIGQYIFVHAKGGNALIIPKSTENIEALKAQLIAISEKYNLPYVSQLNWRW